ncbi:helix-turn-helix transcriptional regulator [Pontimicrobium sp. SW4]|uniref:Helix-turn-helix transcriptional regulator n=1 Tax=Pontimicrobium sp. SW4 TaxID=3153519 RepID=A0AAU7BX23_9FLAO
MEISSKGKYYGSLNSEMSFNDILLTKYDYNEDRTPWHYHENPYFMFVLYGNMIDVNKKNKTLLSPGNLMFTNWQEIHYGEKHSKEAGGFHLELEKKWLKEYDVSSIDIEGSLHLENPFIKCLMNKVYLETKINDSHSLSSIELLILDIFNKMKNVQLEANSKKPNWVKKLYELIIDTEVDYSLSYLSKELNIHPVHLSREFHKYFGSTLGQYIRQLKLNKAIALILTKQYSMTEICYKCGFYDQSHFISNFKSIYKVPPTKFLRLIS